jgi:hypothetical protein
MTTMTLRMKLRRIQVKNPLMVSSTSSLANTNLSCFPECVLFSGCDDVPEDISAAPVDPGSNSFVGVGSGSSGSGGFFRQACACRPDLLYVGHRVSKWVQCVADSSSPVDLAAPSRPSFTPPPSPDISLGEPDHDVSNLRGY